MIRRSRGYFAILPARRGMRAPWLRCRTPGEIADPCRDDESAAPATPGAGQSAAAATPGEGHAGDAPGKEDGTAGRAPTLARATFGHPTF